MRIPIPGNLVFARPLAFRFAMPKKDHLPILFLICLGFQPFGSFASLGMYLAFTFVFIASKPIRGLLLSNWGAMLIYLVFVQALLAFFQPVNPALFGFYSMYWTLGVLLFAILSERVGTSTREEIWVLINWILALDLIINLPPCIIELIRDGIGDWVTGLSGLILEQSASQNRTNSMRAVMFAVLALVNYREQGNRLSLVSLVFNASVLILATSMTTVLSAFAALGAVMMLRRINFKTLLAGAALIGLLLVANFVNQYFLNTESVFDMIFSLDTRWLPKLDIYRQYLTEMVGKNPWLPFIGFGLGNFMNRFVILANYSSFPNFPGKELFSSLFESSLTKNYIVDYYTVDGGDAGSSILIAPWSGVMSLITEWGLLGIGLGILCLLPLLKSLWKSKHDSLRAPGRFLVIFIFLNFIFDCYLDYPELMVPLFIVVLLITRIPELRVPADQVP